MFTRGLVALVVVAVAVAAAAAPTPIRERPRNVQRVAVFSLADALSGEGAPTSFTLGQDGGAASPAGCRIENVQNPHLSTYLRQRQNVTATKGNAAARCKAPVPYLTLSVSIVDVDTHKVVAIQQHPKELYDEAYIASEETIVPCINSNPTNYQVIALGASQENGDYYAQVLEGKIASVDCGHA